MRHPVHIHSARVHHSTNRSIILEIMNHLSCAINRVLFFGPHKFLFKSQSIYSSARGPVLFRFFAVAVFFIFARFPSIHRRAPLHTNNNTTGSACPVPALATPPPVRVNLSGIQWTAANEYVVACLTQLQQWDCKSHRRFESRIIFYVGLHSHCREVLTDLKKSRFTVVRFFPRRRWVKR